MHVGNSFLRGEITSHVRVNKVISANLGPADDKGK